MHAWKQHLHPATAKSGFIRPGKSGRKVWKFGQVRESQESQGVFSRKLKGQGNSGKNFEHIESVNRVSFFTQKVRESQGNNFLEASMNHVNTSVRH